LSNTILRTKFNGDNHHFVIQDFLLNLNNILKISTAKMEFNNYTTLNLNGDFKLETSQYILKATNFSIPKELNKSIFNQINLSGTINGNKDLYTLSNIKINLSSIVNLFATLKLQLNRDFNFNGSIKTNTFSLNSVVDNKILPKNKAANNLYLSTNFSGSVHSLALFSINAALDKTNVIGSMTLKSFKPLNIEQNLAINTIDVSNYIDTNGYKIILTQIHTSGSSTINDSKHLITNLTTNQNLQIQNVTIYGLDFNDIVNQLNSTMSDINKTFTGSLSSLSNSSNVIGSIKKMQNTLNTLQDKQPKNLNLVTNLGTLNANFSAHDGISSTAVYKLTGPVMLSSGHGNINLNDQSWNYIINSQIIKPQPNAIINKLIFTYKLKGKIEQMDGAIDWISLQQQLAEILFTKAKDDVKAYTQQQIHNTIQKEIPQATDKIKNGISNFINGLFK